MTAERFPHLIVTGFFGTDKYTAWQRHGPDFALPARERTPHGASVTEQILKARTENEQNRGVTTDPEKPATIILEIRGEPGFVLKLESLENRRSKDPGQWIEVACVKEEGGVQIAIVHIPEGRLTHFLKCAESYISEIDRFGNYQNKKLIESISEIRNVTLHSFWTDDPSEFPPVDKKVWWEVWVRIVGGRSIWDSFRMTAQSSAVGLAVGNDTIQFPDRVVGLVFGSAKQLMASAELLDMIGELRRAKENPTDFIALGL